MPHGLGHKKDPVSQSFWGLAPGCHSSEVTGRRSLATLVFSNLQRAQTLWKAGSQLLSQLCRPSRSFSFAQPLPFHSANCLQLMESAEPELMNEPLETFEVECAEGEHDLQTPWSWWFDKKVSVLLPSV